MHLTTIERNKMIKGLHYKTEDIMHTDTDIIVVVSMYGVHHNFTSHTDKFEVYNSDLILFSILSLS